MIGGHSRCSRTTSSLKRIKSTSTTLTGCSGVVAANESICRCVRSQSGRAEQKSSRRSCCTREESSNRQKQNRSANRRRDHHLQKLTLDHQFNHHYHPFFNCLSKQLC